jgi:hypothetical protein
MSKAPAYQEYAADYLADETINLMSLEEEGVLARLKNICWVSGSIPADLDKLSRLCKVAPTDVLTRVVKACFKQHPTLSDRLIYPNHEVQKEKQLEWRLKSAEAGRKSAKVRGEKKAKSFESNQPSAEVEPTIQPDANQPSMLAEPLIEPDANSSSLSLSSTSSSSKGKEQKPSRDKREADPRHQPFKLALQTYWIQAHEHRLPFPWAPADAKQLANLLSSAPELSLDQFQQLLANRLKSSGVTHGLPPNKWLAGVMGYSEPNDRYGKTLEVNNGAAGANFRNASKTAPNVGAAAQAIAHAIERDRNNQAFDEVQPEEGSAGYTGDTSPVRRRLIDLRVE